MADDNPNERLARIEEGLATVIERLDRIEPAITRTARSLDDLRALGNLQHQTMLLHVQPLAGVPGMLASIVELLQRLVDRVTALEPPQG